MKHKIKALLATSVLAVSLILALLVLPNLGVNRARFVSADSSFPTATTAIIGITLYDDGTSIVNFNRDGETKYAEVGQTIDKYYVSVIIDPIYAGSEAEALANTRVYGTISHPTAGTIYTGYLTGTEAIFWDVANRYLVRFSDNFSEHTLVAGTYTVTTLYQIYA